METTKATPSIFVNALPYLCILPISESGLDFSVIDQVELGLIQRLYEQLLNPDALMQMVIDLSLDADLEKDALEKRKALQQTFQAFAQQSNTLSLGYPIVTMEDSKMGHPIAAPLFLWKIALMPLDQTNLWQVEQVEQASGYLNPIFKNYLETRFDFDWEEEIGLLGALDSKAVEKTCLELANLCDLSYLSLYPIEPCPAPDAIPNNKILSALVLGSAEPLTLKVAQKLPKNLQARPQKHWRTSLSPAYFNAEQLNAAAQLFKGQHVLIEGASNTGKTHLLQGLIPSLLVDKGTLLVITEDNNTFQQLEQALSQKRLQDIGLLQLKEEKLDKEQLIRYLEQLSKRTKAVTELDSAAYTKQLDLCLALQQRLEQHYQASYAYRYHTWKWSDLVGAALLEHEKSNRALLSAFLQAEDLELSVQEEAELVRALEAHYPRYKGINMLKHPLNALHGRFFEEESTLQESLSESKAGIHLCQVSLRNLYQRFLIFAGDYEAALQYEAEDFAHSLLDQIQQLEHDQQLYQALYGEALDKQGNFQNAKLRLLSMFSRKHQDIRAAKAQLSQQYEVLLEALNAQQTIAFNLKPMDSKSTLRQMEQQLEQARQQVDEWRLDIPKRCAEQRAALSLNSSVPDQLQERFEQLKSNLPEVIEQVNTQAIVRKKLNLPASQDWLSLQRFLQQNLLQFQKIAHEWQDLTAYFHWRRSWRAIGPKAQKIVQALVNAAVDDWPASFRAWFYDQLLLQQYDPKLPKADLLEEQLVERYLEALESMQNLLYKRADIITKERQEEQIKRVKREKDLVLSQVRPIFENKKLQDIFQWIGLEHLGEVFPIVVATPEAALQLLGLSVPIFDWVCVENAAQLKQEDMAPLLKLGNQRLVLSNPEVLETEDSEQAETEVNPTDLSVADWMLEQVGCFVQTFDKRYPLEAPAVVSTFPEEHQNPPATLFQQAVFQHLKPFIDPSRIHFNHPVQQFQVDLWIHPKSPSQQAFVGLVDGGLLQQQAYDFQLAVARKTYLKAQNYPVQYLWTVDWWRNPEEALQPLLAAVLDWDQ